MDQIKRIKRSEATWREIFARHVSSLSGANLQTVAQGASTSAFALK